MANPLLQYNFLLEIDGTSDAVAGFTEVSGITMETDIVEYREGADTATVRKLPGLRKYGNITLKRGYTTNTELWDWRKSVIDGATERKSGVIILLNEAREPALRWEFSEAWVSKYEGPALNATANEAAIESIEIAVEDVRLVVA
ncbi:phage tail protein [Nitrosomonas sp.]|uniref:phage tail protein n=1 Tax=Nitrosomonas sp. TaxID=42353 RepID=UPI00330660E7